jgi:dolichol kinase
MESGEGTAWRNPSDGAKTGAILAPLLGSGLGTAIGAAAHATETTSFAGMTMTASTPKGMAIGSLTGLAAGAMVSFLLVARSHAFYVAEGAPLEMVLPHAVKLPGGAAADRPSTARGGI